MLTSEEYNKMCSCERGDHLADADLHLTGARFGGACLAGRY